MRKSFALKIIGDDCDYNDECFWWNNVDQNREDERDAITVIVAIYPMHMTASQYKGKYLCGAS